nr:transcription antitermination factor NusB [Saprospiraceae bacterium]
MLSRRNIRIKVMQLLYSLGADKQLEEKTLIQLYEKGIHKSYQLLLFTLYVILEVSKISLEESERRKSKLLPQDEDLSFTPKLYENKLVQSLESSHTLEEAAEKHRFNESLDIDLVREVYRKYSKSEAYRKYLQSKTTLVDDRKILLDLFRFLRKDDVFNELLEDNYINLEDDKSLIVGAVKKVIKELPNEDKNFLKEYFPDDDTWMDFGKFLLEMTLEKDEDIAKLISPTLKNWDADRLAAVDTILIKMALSEMLYFPSIPTKVTINEYLEIAKNYSTVKSKDFINGILDTLLKELTESGKIQKKGRGLKD